MLKLLLLLLCFLIASCGVVCERDRERERVFVLCFECDELWD